VISEPLQTDVQPALQLEEIFEIHTEQVASLPVKDYQLISETESQKPKGSMVQQIFQWIHTITPWLWAIVILIVFLPKVGELFIAKAFEQPLADRSSTTHVIDSTIIDWQKTEKLLARALQDARQSSEAYASEKLDVWVDDLTERVDRSFLDWYFGYFNQKEIEYKGFFTGVTANMARWLNPNSQAPEERIAEVITEDFQTEFAKRVLRPQIAQLQLERITEQTVKYYLNELSLNINKIPT
jgi:hypothetical protein